MNGSMIRNLKLGKKGYHIINPFLQNFNFKTVFTMDRES